MTKQPTAKLMRTGPAQTVWFVEWPNTIRKQGKAYFATTYPNSDLVFIETAAKRRPVSSLVGRKILPEIRAAIERANRLVP